MLAVAVMAGVASLVGVSSASPRSGDPLACFAAPEVSGDEGVSAAGFPGDALNFSDATPPPLIADDAEPAVPGSAGDDASPIVAQLAQASPRTSEAADEIQEYDPWLSFNEPMFTFNRQLDRFVVKPIARVWDKILPDPIKQSLANMLDNLAMPKRLVNKLAQGRFTTASLEVARFLVNTTIGFAGFVDIAKELGMEQVNADTGQTFGVYGAGPGPYLILPFLPPLTVRDGIGRAIDGALDPLSYVLPFAATAGMKGGEIVNDRSLNLELFENVEETVLDLYSAVRNAYLQRRQRVIENAVKDRDMWGGR
jgi:phospholipid-binding lipoprotein MlaA